MASKPNCGPWEVEGLKQHQGSTGGARTSSDTPAAGKASAAKQSIPSKIKAPKPQFKVGS